jgi:hypothetical protein
LVFFDVFVMSAVLWFDGFIYIVLVVAGENLGPVHREDFVLALTTDSRQWDAFGIVGPPAVG